MIILYESTETEFLTNGIGYLSDAISCIVTEERNGAYELEMEYPINGIHYSDIQDRAIISAIPSPYRSRQPFRIYKISRPLNGVITVYAAHLSYDLNAIPVAPFSAIGAIPAFNSLKANMTIDNNFTFISAITNGESKVNFVTPLACRTMLGGVEGSFLDTFGGEYEWDTWIVRLWANRGTDNGVSIRYGKNMTELTAETDSENVVTGIYPYWYKDSVLVEANPRIIWIDEAQYQKAVPVDFTTVFDKQPTAEQLTERAEQYIADNDIGTVPTTINVSFVTLSQTSGYESITVLEKCDLCDTVTIQYETLGVNVKSKIVKIVTDVLTKRYISMEVGTIRADVAQTISETENKIDRVVRPDGSLVAEALRGFINGSLVNLYAQYDAAEPSSSYAVLFENNDPTSDLYGALAIGTQGIMIARNKKTGGAEWDWTTAMTFEGLMANIIVTGVLTDKLGINYWNLDTGDFSLSATAKVNGSPIANKSSVEDAVNGLDEALNQQEIVDRMTRNGVAEGIYLQNGLLYINGTYMVMGKISSVNGRVYFDLDNNELSCSRMVSSDTGQSIQTVADVGYPEGISSSSGSRFRVYPIDSEDTAIQLYVNKNGIGNLVGPPDRMSIYTSEHTRTSLEVYPTMMIIAAFPETGSSSAKYGRIQLFSVGSSYSEGNVEIGPRLAVRGPTTISGTLTVSGSKNRIVSTEHYGERLQYCYEMVSPIFGDIGEGMTDDNGECVINLDDIFSETVSAQIEYQVFIQKEGCGDLWIAKKSENYFIVKGTENLKFSWEIKVKQKDYEYERLEQDAEVYAMDAMDVTMLYENEIEELLSEQEAILYETVK